jgi:hypothetical protein
MMWTAVVKQDKKHEVVQFSGPFSFSEAYAQLVESGYEAVALIKGTHPVATDGGVELQPRTITSIVQNM